MRLHFYQPTIARIGVRPHEPNAIIGPRKLGSRRPHTDATVAAVRDFVEQIVLTYSEIAAKTGVGRASICRWTRDGQWKRPLFAPRATDTVPSHRASARLKARTLAARLSALAERYIRELEDSASVDPDKLGEALELLRMAKLAARSKRRRSATEAATGGSLQTSSQFWDAGARTVIGSLRSGGVNPERAPEEALQDFIDSRAPPPEKRRRRRGRRDSGNAHHARMLERDER